MAFKHTQTLMCLLFIWLNLVEVSSFLTFKGGKIIDSFNKNAQEIESFDRGDGNAKSEAQTGRLIIGEKQTPYSKDSYDTLSSGLGSHNPLNDEDMYQSDDAAWMNLKQLWGQVYGLNTVYTPAVESLLGMKPKLDCVGDLMKLTVHGRDASFGSNVLIDRGRVAPLPLSQLPSECGHTLQRTWRDFVFIIPFNGCYVLQESDMYILPLLWWGLPLKMSCSTSTLAQSTPAVSCYTNGMIVTLQRGISMNLKVKVTNEWHPLMKASAKCGYSLVSHPEGVVIHAPYMPCMEAKDGMFTLSMAAESEFNLSCPTLSLGLPMTDTDHASKNDNSIFYSLISSTPAPTTSPSVESAQPAEMPSQTTSTSSTIHYHVPDQPYFKPVAPNYPFVLFHPNVPPTVISSDPKAVVTPPPITQRQQAPIYLKPHDPKPPQMWYPWYPKPNFVLAPDPTKNSLVPPYPREPMLPPTEAPKPPLNPLFYLLKPTSIPLQDKTTRMAPPVKWAPMYPPSKLVYPLYPGKPGSGGTSSAVLSEVPQWLYPFQTQPKPNEPPRLKPSERYAPPKPVLPPPIPAPTRNAEQLQFHHFLWYKPLPQHNLQMPFVPTKVSEVKVSDTAKHSNSIIKGPPTSLRFDFTSSLNPTPAPSKISEEVALTSSTIKVPQTSFNLSHAHFHCPTFCPGPPLVSYHHHNHHHFGQPFPVHYPAASSLTKITAEVQSSLVQHPSSTSAQFPFIQGMGYNYSPYFSKVVALPPATQYLAPRESPIIKPTHAPDTKLLMKPTPCPYIFRTLASNGVSSQPANMPPFVLPWEPTKPPPSSFQNTLVAEPLAHLFQSLKPAFYQAEMQHFIPQWRQHIVGPFSQNQQDSLKPTVSPDHGKNLARNYWYQAASHASPAMSDAPDKVSKHALMHPPINSHNPLDRSTTPPQPKETHDENPPMQLNSVPADTHLYDPQNGKPTVPIFRDADAEPFDSYWVPAVQSNQKTKYPDGSMMGPLRFVLRHMERRQ